MRRSPRTVVLAATVTVLLTGCGGGRPHMARQDTAPLIKLADQIAREAPCAQARDIRALDARRIALVNTHRIPPALQESFSSGVNVLVAQTPTCLPPVPAATVAPPVAPEHAKKPKHDHHGKGGGGD